MIFQLRPPEIEHCVRISRNHEPSNIDTHFIYINACVCAVDRATKHQHHFHHSSCCFALFSFLISLFFKLKPFNASVFISISLRIFFSIIALSYCCLFIIHLFVCILECSFFLSSPLPKNYKYAFFSCCGYALHSWQCTHVNLKPVYRSYVHISYTHAHTLRV